MKALRVLVAKGDSLDCRLIARMLEATGSDICAIETVDAGLLAAEGHPGPETPTVAGGNRPTDPET